MCSIYLYEHGPHAAMSTNKSKTSTALLLSKSASQLEHAPQSAMRRSKSLTLTAPSLFRSYGQLLLLAILICDSVDVSVPINPALPPAPTIQSSSSSLPPKVPLATARGELLELVDLLTVRALKSPRETASRVDFKREVANISMTLINADMFTEAEMICNGAIDQMECVANAGSLEGDDTWDFIISELRQTINK